MRTGIVLAVALLTAAPSLAARRTIETVIDELVEAYGRTVTLDSYTTLGDCRYSYVATLARGDHATLRFALEQTIRCPDQQPIVCTEEDLASPRDIGGDRTLRAHAHVRARALAQRRSALQDLLAGRHVGRAARPARELVRRGTPARRPLSGQARLRRDTLSR